MLADDSDNRGGLDSKTGAQRDEARRNDDAYEACEAYEDAHDDDMDNR